MSYESEVSAYATATAEATKRQEMLRARLEASATVVRSVMDKKFAHRPPKDDIELAVLRWAYHLSTGELSVDKGRVYVDVHKVHPLFLTGDQGVVGREVRKLIRHYKVKQSETIKQRELAAMRSEFVVAEQEYLRAKKRVTEAAEALWAKRIEMPDIERHIEPYLTKETTNG